MDGTPIEDANDLIQRIGRRKPGQQVTFTMLRTSEQLEIEEMEIDVTLGERPSEASILLGNQQSNRRREREQEEEGAEDSAANVLGFGVADLTRRFSDQLDLDPGEEGVLVMTVDPSGVAARRGLQRGDLIKSVNRQTVTDVEEFESVMTSVESGGPVLLYVRRINGSHSFISMRIPRAR